MMLGILNFEVESRDLKEQGFRPIATDGGSRLCNICL